jgi:hypothetical protein
MTMVMGPLVMEETLDLEVLTQDLAGEEETSLILILDGDLVHSVDFIRLGEAATPISKIIKLI